jgi:outer membrane protein OmpA-like peptidoglycan-associated protein
VAKAPALTKPKAVANAAPKLKAPKSTKAKIVAKAEPKAKSTKSEAKTAKASGASTAKISAAKNKNLASNFEPPPKPPIYTSAANANADMPGAAIEPAKPAPAPSTNKSLSTSVSAAPQKLAAAEPPTPSPAVSAKTEIPKPAPEPAKAETPKAEAAPKAETKADTAKSDAKVALLTPPPTSAPTADGGAALTIPFAKEGATLSDNARGALVTVAKHALGDSAIQLQVLAYASGDEDSASKARRLSLSRALAVRSFLIDQGVHSTRIEVRALGNKVPDGPPDRVDLVEQKH